MSTIAFAAWEIGQTRICQWASIDLTSSQASCMMAASRGCNTRSRRTRERLPDQQTLRLEAETQAPRPIKSSDGEGAREMTWRNQGTHGEETKAVKAALVQAGYASAKVGHGSGTAWGWLHVKVNVPGPAACSCAQTPIGRCDACGTTWRTHHSKVISIAQAVTGRRGEYDGDINAQIDME